MRFRNPLTREEREACLWMAEFFRKQAERRDDYIPESTRAFITWAVVNCKILKRKRKL